MNIPVEGENLTHIFLDLTQMRSFAQEPLIMERADGIWYWDVGGRKILDGISGIFVVNVGHHNERVIRAIKDQLEKVEFAPPLHATNLPALELVRLLASVTPGELNTVKLLSGGSEATEAAMKLARQYHYQTGNRGKHKVISRYQGYHGATMGALSATGTKKRKAMFEPVMAGYLHVMPPTCYRCPFGLEYPDCGILCATIIEKVIEEEDASTVSSLIVEPIGNTGGIIVPPEGYLRIIRDICTRYNVILIFDEIITGFGRTGSMFAAQTFNVEPDIICMGKGMSSGYSPLAAIAFRDSIAEAFLGRSEDGIEFAHGHTFGGNPVSSAAGIACIGEIIDRKLCDQAQKMEGILRKELGRLSRFKVVGEIRGKGLLLGIEFVQDSESKKRFPDDVAFGVRVGKTALKKGLLLRYDPHWIAIAPPLIISEDEIRLLVDILEESVTEVVGSLNRGSKQ